MVERGKQKVIFQFSAAQGMAMLIYNHIIFLQSFIFCGGEF